MNIAYKLSNLLFIIAALMIICAIHNWGWFFGFGAFFAFLAISEEERSRNELKKNQNP